MLKIARVVTIGAVGMMMFNLFVPTLFGQSTHTHLLLQEVKRKSELKIMSYPDTFLFDPAEVSGKTQFRFHNDETSGDLSTELVIHDGRQSGGFKVFLTIQDTIEATHKTLPEYGDVKVRLRKKKMIENSNLYVVTSAKGDKVVNGVAYNSGAVGPTSISAPWDATGQDLSSFETYEKSGVSLVTTPIALLDGSLPAYQGRNGNFAIDVNYALKIGRYQPPGDYKMNFLYTVVAS